MVHNETIDLISRYTEPGSSIINEEITTVFCGKKSVSQREFYAAEAAGLKPQVVFEIEYFNWASIEIIPTMVEFRGQRFNIIRTYEKIDERIIEVVVG